jgi:hypothetical protein
MADKEIEIKLSHVTAALIMEVQMEKRMINDLNKYLDGKHKNGGEDFGHSLVGQISHGEQLKIDDKDLLIVPFIKFVAQLANVYLEHFSRHVGAKDMKRVPHIHSLWSVHSYERDYNPLHDHGTDTPMGISFTTWTKIPPQIANNNNYSPLDLYNSGGGYDGFLQFHFGQTSIRGLEELRPALCKTIKPEVGKLLFFPSWCQHTVYPFEGPGERRTVAGNLNMFPLSVLDDPNNTSIVL